MPQVDFYILSASGEKSCVQFACRLTEKAYRLQHKVHLQTHDEASAERLDELLWTFREGSFVPHEMLRASGNEAPVTIGCGSKLPENPDLLVNLTPTVPSFAGQFSRIVEVVDSDPSRRETSRSRFRNYREKGFSLESHKID